MYCQVWLVKVKAEVCLWCSSLSYLGVCLKPVWLLVFLAPSATFITNRNNYLLNNKITCKEDSVGVFFHFLCELFPLASSLFCLLGVNTSWTNLCCGHTNEIYIVFLISPWVEQQVSPKMCQTFLSRTAPLRSPCPIGEMRDLCSWCEDLGAVDFCRRKQWRERDCCTQTYKKWTEHLQWDNVTVPGKCHLLV